MGMFCLSFIGFTLFQVVISFLFKQTREYSGKPFITLHFLNGNHRRGLFILASASLKMPIHKSIFIISIICNNCNSSYLQTRLFWSILQFPVSFGLLWFSMWRLLFSKVFKRRMWPRPRMSWKTRHNDPYYDFRYFKHQRCTKQLERFFFSLSHIPYRNDTWSFPL